MKFVTTAAVAALALAVAAGPAPALAAGMDNSSTTSSSQSSNPALDKANEYVNSGLYAAAITQLETVLASDEGNADAHNLMGFSYRKMGDTQNAFNHYRRALEIDPEHLGANEYLGELYLELGDLANAEVRLQVLDDACTFGCDEYYQLKEAIETYRAANAS